MVEIINNYYLSHFSELPFAKQFHFASRTWLWNQDNNVETFLHDAKTEFCGNPPESVKDVLQDIINNLSPDFGSKNAAELRAPYFAKYPLLKKVLPLLFRLLFIQTVYGFDTREQLYGFVSKEELENLKENLIKDSEAIAILSTHASNFLYLYHRFLLNDETGFDIEHLYQIGKTKYDLTNKTHLQLYIYLYTHCIIGESLFYKRQISSEKLPIYQKMVKELDYILNDRFMDINLDNKFEILTCFKICGHVSKLTQKVYDEAEQSWSDNGDFLIDKHNNNPQLDNTNLEKSEHRNVLAIISSRDFSPTDQVIR